MAEPTIQFNDGAAYERFMGIWSRLAGEIFVEWLAPPPGLRWVDVGCGNGAFTELLMARCAPAAVEGIDPSEGQLAFARTRPGASGAQFRQGDAMALPFPDKEFEAAVMALVIFFVPEPAKGVAEMARVVRAGGIVSAYAWDMEGGGFPARLMGAELRAMGFAVPAPPNPGASRLDSLTALWAGAGLEAIETRAITVARSFADFDEYWAASLAAPTAQARLAAMPPDDVAQLKARLHERLRPDSDGRITIESRANAIQGRLPQ